MKVRVLYFASLREALSCASEDLTLPVDVSTAAALRAHLRSRGGVWHDALAEGRSIRVAVDQAMATADAPLRDGAEVAFFPPVTGG